MSGLFKQVDCIELYVPNLDDGVSYYRGSLGLQLLWRTDTAVGMGMDDSGTEIVLQTDRKWMNVDFKVNSVTDSV